MPALDDHGEKLAAPCRWCGFNGPEYWQSGTHTSECPWHKIGGQHERAEVLELDMVVNDREAVADALEKLARYEHVARYQKIS